MSQEAGECWRVNPGKGEEESRCPAGEEGYVQTMESESQSRRPTISWYTRRMYKLLMKMAKLSTESRRPIFIFKKGRQLLDLAGV